MANKHKGEVSFAADGKTYTLSLSINAMCEMDDAFGVDDALGSLMSTGKATVKQLRTIFFVALRHHHPEIADEKMAAGLVGYGQMVKLLTDAIELSNVREEGGAPPNPQQGAGAGKRGTGPAS